MRDDGGESVRVDEVTAVLRECEATLRSLREQRRLTAEALRAFVELAARVRKEMDRRRLADRRQVPRHTPDRRAATPAVEPA